ncbi:hypothetical protein [Vibrio phage JSF12]|uniref:Transcriptional coactivator p15 (PC4) C-terminal domain-containing protein n=2 Tax=Jesfedecavirus TaxID=2560156 RepID=A0A2D0Z692_9CAUD|nr:transcriptional regulator [Vibrio phage JSF10]YP_009794829.1 transcriptional regulator [Vibrio phage JSF12]ASV43435.1 hypothetical protein [Vibrio phage JSF10]ASV43664.1 hypothetical protein [Vibrio phage JSF12]
MRENDSFEGHEELIEEIVYENFEKGEQIRLTVTEFRDSYYLGLRKWVIDAEDDWCPTYQGFSFPYNLATTSKLFSALTKILSKAEVLHEVLDNLNYQKPDQ